jgi:hypothetical protein
VVPGGAGESSAWLRKPVDPSANPDAKRGQGGMSEQLAPKAAKSGPRPSRGKNNAPAKPFGEAYDGGDAWRGHGKKPDANAIKSQSSLDALTGASTASGTSVFDPVLCELVYRWFCVPGGHVLDPFAGESTKGIVASYLRFKYTGIDLRPEQVAANEAQWAEIGPRLQAAQEPASAAPAQAAGPAAEFIYDVLELLEDPRRDTDRYGRRSAARGDDAVATILVECCARRRIE